jgi:hypothetical protein
VKVNGKAIKDVDDFRKKSAALILGTRVMLMIRRDGLDRAVVLKL